MTMYDPIIARSFSRNEQKKFGHCAFIGCLLIALSICTVFKPQYLSPLSVLNLRLSSGGAGLEDMLKVRDTTNISSSLSSSTGAPAGLKDILKVRDTTTTNISSSLSSSTGAPAGLKDILKVRDTTTTNISSSFSSSTTGAPAGLKDLKVRDITTTTNISSSLSTGTAAGLEDMLKVTDDTNISPPLEIKPKQIKPPCSLTDPITDICEIEGQIAINGKSSTIFISSSHMPISPQNTTTSWTIKPYPRKGNYGAMISVKEWTVKLQSPENIPNCTQNHNSPAILFSAEGYSGNHFHDFSDLIIPLYITSKKFNGDVQFLTSGNKLWWPNKFKVIFNKLSRHKIIDIDREEGIHCFKSAIIGLRRHRELGIDTKRSPDALSMKDFRRFLRTAYALNRTTVAKFRKGHDQNGLPLLRPRLMIISRGKTRVLTNEDRVAKMAQKSGYNVILADVKLTTNLSRFAELVNSCDVLMGVHGAGLTNMVFLPDNAVVIQVVPFGKIDIFAKMDFGEPSKDMNLRYLEYKIKLEESSLIKKYPLDHVAIRDPLSLHKQGWGVLRDTYLNNQDVELDLRRFRGTLMKAFKLLHQ